MYHFLLLYTLRNNYNKMETKKPDSTYLAAILRFKFIIALVAAEHILKSTIHLSKFLHGDKCELVEAVKESEVVFNQITPEWNNQFVWDSLFDMAVSIVDQFEILPIIPRRTGRQINRTDHPTEITLAIIGSDLILCYYPFLDCY